MLPEGLRRSSRSSSGASRVLGTERAILVFVVAEPFILRRTKTPSTRWRRSPRRNERAEADGLGQERAPDPPQIPFSPHLNLNVKSVQEGPTR